MPNPRGSDAPPAAGRRFRPRAAPTLATLVAILLFVSAGNWQRGRMQAKDALRAQADAAAQSAPVDVGALPATADWTALRFRPAQATGEFDAPRQILVDNKVHAGRAGYDVVTPLRIAGGPAVLVVRGWIAQGASRADVPGAPPPAGTVTVRGRLALPSASYLELQVAPPNGPVWQNLDPARFAAATGLPVLPVVIEAVGDAPDGLVRDWPAPDFGSDKHRIYMVQWYAFAALAAVLWLGFTVRRARRPRHE